MELPRRLAVLAENAQDAPQSETFEMRSFNPSTTTSTPAPSPKFQPGGS
jgi:hypothetical protein